ncbi:Hydrogenase-4 component E [hydrothermal vent metagenome]|uniref:Hydrogenase-4 component E n=1 Tax=hydrothermal vent metagenome TaxID=652676 RepID=A0A3B1AT39_9ZZZZ
MLNNLPIEQQAILFLASLVLFTSFILLAQTRVLSMVHAFAAQGTFVAITTALVAFATEQHHLYISAILTLALKAIFIPWLLHRLVHQLKIDREPHHVEKPAFVLMTGAALVIFCYYVTLPITQLADGITRNTIAISMAVVLLGMLMLVTRNKAVSQVIGFMSLENGLFFAAVAATHGMPMVVELGIAFDVLVAAIIFGVFFFHIRESIDSLDVNQLSRLSEHEDE